MRWLHVCRIFLLAAGLLAGPAARAAGPGAPADVPHLDDAGREGFAAFLGAGGHKAFAIAPGGAWAWTSGMATREAAEQGALSQCEDYSFWFQTRCRLYAVDGYQVFDAEAWRRSLGPYMSADEAATAPVGTEPGQQFPDLAVTAPDGKPVTLSAYRGKAVLVHFWATWCPPCQRELPELAKLVRAYAGRDDVVFVLLQVREPAALSRRWVTRSGIEGLALHDSGAEGPRDQSLRTVDGGTLSDRELAPAFPTTYLLDKRGIVVLKRPGPISDWPRYAPFLDDIAERSGG